MSEYNINNAKNDIENLQDQNKYDFQEIKRLDDLIKEYDNRVKQSINFNNLINKKIESDYENIKKIILDENASAALNEKIDDKYNSNKSKIEELQANVSEQLYTIETNIGNRAYKKYVDERDADVLRQVEQGATDEQLKNAIQTKIDDGTISSLAVGNDTIQNINIKDNVIFEQKLAFIPNLNICSNITDVQLGISGTSVTIYLYAKSNIELWYYLNTGGNKNSIELETLNKSYTLANYKSLIWDLTTNTLEVINTGLSNKNKHILLATNENGIISVGYIANLYAYIRNYSDMRSIQQTSVTMFLTNPNSLYLYEENKQDGYVFIKFDGSITLNTSRIYNVLDVSKTYDEIVTQ